MIQPTQGCILPPDLFLNEDPFQAIIRLFYDIG